MNMNYIQHRSEKLIAWYSSSNNMKSVSTKFIFLNIFKGLGEIQIKLIPLIMNRNNPT